MSTTWVTPVAPITPSAPPEPFVPQTCASCAWWVPWQNQDHTAKHRLGECRAHAPMLILRERDGSHNTITKWASSREVDFCGAHRPRKEAA